LDGRDWNDTALALSTLTMLAAGDSAAAKVEPAPPAARSVNSTPSSTAVLQTEPKPTHSLPDLIVGSFRIGDDLKPGEEFGIATLVKNDGEGTAKPVRVVVIFERGFTNVRVSDAPGFACSVEGQAAICKGGQIAAGQGVAIGVGALAVRSVLAMPGGEDILVEQRPGVGEVVLEHLRTCALQERQPMWNVQFVDVPLGARD
jgi:hypothetical protein